MRKVPFLVSFLFFVTAPLILCVAQPSSAGWLTNLIQNIFSKEAVVATEQAAKNATKNAAKSEATNATEKGAVKAGEQAATHTTGGSSTILGIRIGIKNTGEWAAHHIIPVQLKNHPILNKIGMDFDHAANGIALPTKPGVDPKLPLHCGSHPSYTAAVAKELDSIPTNLSIEETRRRVIAIQEKFRRELESGKPLHEKYGAPNPWY